MFSPVVVAILLLAGQSVSGPAKPTAPKPTEAAPATYQKEAAVVELSDTAYRYNDDGTGTEEVHVRVKVQNDAGARAFSVLSVAFASGTQKAKVESVTVTHPDGTTTVTPPADAMTLPAPVTQQAPLYSDLDILQIPVRGLRAGDTLEYRMEITRTSADAPNEFWDSESLAKGQVYLSWTVSLDVSADKYVQVWSNGLHSVVTKKDGRVVYRWTTDQLKPTSSDDKDKTPDKSAGVKPDVAWTSFHSWQEVGEWYRKLAALEVVPNGAVRAEADDLTKDAKTPDEQVKAIYTFVSTHIRYIGIDFGIGRYQPHPAAEVLANQYGDCKDKDTLLESLLQAKGFTAGPALIGVGIDAIKELPSPGQFNHVITTVQLPSGQIWLDSTPEVTPYRLLMPAIRDKLALVMPSSGKAELVKTPAEPPYPFVDNFVATGTLKPDGEMDAKVKITDRTDMEIVMRAVARVMAPAQWDKATQYLAMAMGFSGTTSNSNFGRADDFSSPMQVSYDYTKKPYGDWDNFRILPLFPLVKLPDAPDKKPTNDLKLGAPRTEIAVSHINLPPGFSADLPDAVHVKTPFATVDRTYELENGVLTISRTVVVLESKLPPSSWQDYKKFLSDTSVGNLNFIQLTSTSKASGPGPHPPLAGKTNAVAAELIREANNLERTRDWAEAKKKLDEAKDIQAEQPYLWSNYGYLAMMRGHFDEADKDYRHELELHPDETYVVMLEAGLLHSRHKDKDASSILQTAVDRSASNEGIDLMLASLQAESSLPDAIATLRKASAALPKSTFITTTLATYLIQNNQKAEAEVLLTKILNDSQDAGDLNNASYSLAETGDDLPLAEQKSRESLDLLGKESQVDIGSANGKSFQQATMLVASWDTLGYILLHENKLEEASEYLEAAWRNVPSLTEGLHYGDALDKLGKKTEALRVEKLSWKDRVAPGQVADQKELRAAMQQLKQEGVRTSVDDPAIELQNARTFHIKLRSSYKSFVSATFRLQLEAGGVRNVLRVSGDAQLDSVTDAIRKLSLQHLVPAHSSAYLLRDAVMTCPPGSENCVLVLLPMGPIGAERSGN
ncbi:MAG TPA: DUF3857 domain-containing protein [Terracidiphilus sp.]|nr:DUF3857 domain-containing protein [Terracidiphilus sp.]